MTWRFKLAGFCQCGVLLPELAQSRTEGHGLFTLTGGTGEGGAGPPGAGAYAPTPARAAWSAVLTSLPPVPFPLTLSLSHPVPLEDCERFLASRPVPSPLTRPSPCCCHGDSLTWCIPSDHTPALQPATKRLNVSDKAHVNQVNA